MVGFAGAHPRLVKYWTIAAVALGLVLARGRFTTSVSLSHRRAAARRTGTRVLRGSSAGPWKSAEGGMTALEFVDRLNDLQEYQADAAAEPGQVLQ